MLSMYLHVSDAFQEPIGSQYWPKGVNTVQMSLLLPVWLSLAQNPFARPYLELSAGKDRLERQAKRVYSGQKSVIWQITLRASLAKGSLIL